MKFLIGFVLGIVLFPLGVYFFLTYAHIPLSTHAAPWPMERTLAHWAVINRLHAEGRKLTTPPLAAGDLLAGAHTYRQDCSGCHGLPGHDNPGAIDMYPHPPQLFEPRDMVTDDPPGVPHQIIKTGVRMTGMPSFGDRLSDRQIWQLAFLLTQANRLPAGVEQALTAPRAPLPTPAKARGLRR